ncbi:hypothetical protein ACI3E1_03825 [Ligilactobacillus sp. LYQ139]
MKNWKRLTDKERVHFAMGEYRKYHVGETYKVGSDKLGYVQ